MKRFELNTVLVGGLLVSSLMLGACGESQGPAEKVGEKIDQASEKTLEAAEDAAEKVEDEVEKAKEKIKDSTG